LALAICSSGNTGAVMIGLKEGRGSKSGNILQHFSAFHCGPAFLP